MVFSILLVFFDIVLISQRYISEIKKCKSSPSLFRQKAVFERRKGVEVGEEVLLGV